MANTFLRKTKATGTADVAAVIYTTPASTTTVVIGFMIANITAAEIEVTIDVAGTNMGTAIPIPAGSSLSALDGKMVLEATDTVEVACNTLNGCEMILSIMEIT